MIGAPRLRLSADGEFGPDLGSSDRIGDGERVAKGSELGEVCGIFIERASRVFEAAGGDGLPIRPVFPSVERFEYLSEVLEGLWVGGELLKELMVALVVTRSAEGGDGLGDDASCWCGGVGGNRLGGICRGEVVFGDGEC